jgi:hypothetical protein
MQNGRLVTTATAWKAALAVAIAVPRLAAVQVGESYKDLLAELGKPAGRVVAGDITILQYAGTVVKLKNGVVTSFRKVAPATRSPAREATAVPAPTPGQVKTERVIKLAQDLREAVARVREIVNQPVTQLPVDVAMSIGTYNGWYGGRPPPPDFENADVRTTQDTSHYQDHDYGTSPLKPGIAFKLDEVAYNSQLNFFYVDPTVPKKKLSQNELEEINGLYREIGNDLTVLKSLGITDPERAL